MVCHLKYSDSCLICMNSLIEVYIRILSTLQVKLYVYCRKHVLCLENSPSMSYGSFMHQFPKVVNINFLYCNFCRKHCNLFSLLGDSSFKKLQIVFHFTIHELKICFVKNHALNIYLFIHIRYCFNSRACQLSRVFHHQYMELG